MTNDNNTPKSASHMLFHELAANGGTKRDTRDIVDRLNTFTASNADWPTIADAAAEIIQLRAKVDELEAAQMEANANNEYFKKNHR
jgi:hypothetical protein